MSKQSKRNTQKNIAKKRAKRSQKSKEKQRDRSQKLNELSKIKKQILDNLFKRHGDKSNTKTITAVY